MKAYELEKKLGKKKRKTTSELKQIMFTGSATNPGFCLFLGAGASRSSGIRTAGEMVAQWRSEVYSDLSGQSSLTVESEMIAWLEANASDWFDKNKEYASLIERKYPLPSNRRRFIESEVGGKTPSIGYAYLVRLAESGFLRTIFTTNFDDLLNEAFYQFSSQRPLVCAHDSSVRSISLTSLRPKIIKLHGDYLFDDLKNTSSETKQLEENMKHKLLEFAKEYGLVISGYSGGDKSITRNLEDFLELDYCLQNGLFWCFREQDEVTQDAISILEKDNSFYVLTSGFDELMADFYSLLNTAATPFNSKLASDRASTVINSYLQNIQLKNSTSKTITLHLQALEAEKNGSLLSDMIKDLQAEKSASGGLSDESLLVYLEIEKLLKDRNPEGALARISDELSKTSDTRFRKALLQRRLICSMLLNRLSEASDAVQQLQALDPRNFYIAISRCSLLEGRDERIDFLHHLTKEHPYSSLVFNEYADELGTALERRNARASQYGVEDLTTALKRSLDLDPNLDNWAWRELFRVHARRNNVKKDDGELLEIVRTHIARNAHAVETSRLLFAYCQKFKVTEFDEKNLFAYLLDAYKNHFPKESVRHLEVFVDACVEFDGLRFLRPLLDEARDDDSVKNEPKFLRLLMRVQHDIFRDLDGAVAMAEKFLKTHPESSVESELVELHVEAGNLDRAKELLTKLKGGIGHTRWATLEAKIYEGLGRYQDAIDTIENIPDPRDFDEKYTSMLAYLELKMGMPARAYKRCSKFLHSRSFAISFESEIINYEYAKSRDTGKLDRKRLNEVLSRTDNEIVKGVCSALLGDKLTAVKTIRQEAEKRFSKINECLRWPVLSDLREQLIAIRTDLLKAKRSLSDLPASLSSVQSSSCEPAQRPSG